MRLADVTWTDARDADVDVAFVPVGSTEQHGPHAPLGTDTLTAVAVARAAAAAYGAGPDDPANEDWRGGDADDEGDDDRDEGDDDRDEGDYDRDEGDRGDAAVTPAIPVGVSEEHRSFDGTMWVRPDAFRAYVNDAAASLPAHGVDRVVFVNGHGGNVEALAEVARRFSRDPDHDGYAVAFTWFEAVGEHAGEMGHAGPLETALLRATHPDLVREDRMESARDGASDGWGEWVSGVNLAHDAEEFTENGVVGDPTAGDADRGRELLALATEALVDLARAVVDREHERTP